MNDRLLKLINMTQSDNDNEALMALRMANKLMKENNKSWDTLVVVEDVSQIEALNDQYNALVDKYNQLARDYFKLRVEVVEGSLSSRPTKKFGGFW